MIRLLSPRAGSSAHVIDPSNLQPCKPAFRSGVDFVAASAFETFVAFTSLLSIPFRPPNSPPPVGRAADEVVDSAWWDPPRRERVAPDAESERAMSDERLPPPPEDKKL